MKLNEDYFRRLLNSPNSLEAIHTLNGFWCARLSSAVESSNGLTQPERLVHLCLVYVGEVGNGGHSQFFWNSSGDATLETRDGLLVLGLERLAMALEKAKGVFPDRVEITSRAARLDSIARMDDSQTALWKTLDRIVWESEPWDRLLSYARQNESEILIPERSS